MTSPRRAKATAAATFALAALLVASTGQIANAVAVFVPLNTAAPFAVLASTTITSTGLTTISGDVGLHPGSDVVGFPPGVQTAGAAYIADPVSLQARTDASNAFTAASGQVLTSPLIAVELGGQTLTPDLYESGGAFQINGTLTLDAGGDAAAVFILRSLSTLITGSASNVSLINGADPCNVFWIVPSSATLGTGSTIAGTILSATSISAATGTTVDGRLLALNGAVTLDATSVSTDCSALTNLPGAGITIEQASAETAARRLAATGVESDVALWFASGALIAGGFMVLFGLGRRSRSGSPSLRV